MKILETWLFWLHADLIASSYFDPYFFHVDSPHCKRFSNKEVFRAWHWKSPFPFLTWLPSLLQRRAWSLFGESSQSSSMDQCACVYRYTPVFLSLKHRWDCIVWLVSKQLFSVKMGIKDLPILVSYRYDMFFFNSIKHLNFLFSALCGWSYFYITVRLSLFQM